jgi:peptidoglycan hydrolase CwlO-like protein
MLAVKGLLRRGWSLLIAGVIVAAVAAAVLMVELPAASAHDTRSQHAVALHQQQAIASHTRTLTTQTVALRTQTSVQQAKNAKLAKEIAAQRKQIAALRKKIKSLGG